MNKKEFFEYYIKDNLKENDKPHNRQIWNDTLDFLDKSGSKVNFSWVKMPKKYFGEA